MSHLFEAESQEEPGVHGHEDDDTTTELHNLSHIFEVQSQGEPGVHGHDGDTPVHPLDAQGQRDLGVHGQEVDDNSAQRFDCDDTAFNLSHIFEVDSQEHGHDGDTPAEHDDAPAPPP